MLSGLAEALIEWADDRFGRTVAWVLAIFAVLVLTVGAIGIAILLGIGGHG